MYTTLLRYTKVIKKKEGTILKLVYLSHYITTYIHHNLYIRIYEDFKNNVLEGMLVKLIILCKGVKVSHSF